jgi:hypothetical protein
MRTNHKCLIHVTEPASGLAGRPAECHLLKVFHEEVGNDRWKQWAHGNSVRLFVELAIETEGGSEDKVEEPDVTLIELPTQKIRGIPKRHSREESDDIKTD